MSYLVRQFALKEDGAITVDWVVLTAGVLSLAIAASAVIWDGSAAKVEKIDNRLDGGLVSTTF